jgi:hypothetical protein
MFKFVLSASVLVLVAIPAAADVCTWNSRPVTDQALKLMTVGAVLQEFCEPCGDAKATRIVVRTVAIDKTSDPTMFILKVNGEEIDLAYIYVLAGQGRKEWTNVGHLLMCGLEDDDAKRILPPGLAANS